MKGIDMKYHARSSFVVVNRAESPSNTTREMKQRQLCELINWVSSSGDERKKKKRRFPDVGPCSLLVRRVVEAERGNKAPTNQEKDQRSFVGFGSTR